MAFYADLHIHSKYSRATSRDCDLEHLAWWAARKGVAVVGTGDFTHPGWFEELRDQLVPAEPGLFRLRPDVEGQVADRLPGSCRGAVRFMLTVEISTIYKKDGATRKVHHLVYAPDFATAEAFNRKLATIGNLASDGRPILGLDSRHLLEIVLESGDGAYLVPAHIWTPWFAVLGSRSGFDAVEACYDDLASHVFAVETGLSSDPAMNWRVSALDRYRLVSNSDAHSPPMLGREASVFTCPMDYYAIRAALASGDGFGGTVEFFPEEGKYHLDGHRECGVRLEPAETRQRDGACPTCGKPVTVGVLHRVDCLADRSDGVRPEGAAPFRSLVQLNEIVGEIHGVGPRSKTVQATVDRLVHHLGPELSILEHLPVEAIRQAGSSVLAEAVERLRKGQVRRQSGFDGQYGTVHMFTPEEIERHRGVLFDVAVPVPTAPAAPSAQQPPSTRLSTEPSARRGPAPAPPAACPPDDLPLLAGLDEDQRTAATLVDGPLLIVAGPGTGKTRTLTYRIAHLISDRGVPPEQCLALTFTRRAAEEIRQRLAALVPQAADRILMTTFHGLGLRILREQHASIGRSPTFRIADDAEQLALVGEVLGSTGRQARRQLDQIGAAKRARAVRGALGSPGQATGAEGAIEGDAVDDGGRDRYEEALRARDLVDLDDLLVRPVELLAGRPDLIDSYRAQYRWISVDEYQDVDQLQHRLLRLLAPAEANICAIGDPDQAIYGFRGADVECFLRFRQDFPAARRVHLSRNYRSSLAVVEGALQAIAPATLVPDRRLIPSGHPGSAPSILVHHAATERAEAEFVVHTIETMLGGSSYFSIDSGRVGAGAGVEVPLSFADIAVLYRTDAQSEALAEALGRAGMPFQKRSHDRLLDRPGVSTIVQRLRAEAAPGTTGPSIIDRIVDGAAAVSAAGDADAATDPADPADSRQFELAVDLLSPLAERFGTDVDRFLAELAMGAEVDSWDPRADRVSLLTLHATKGLEFPVVFLTGCEDGLLPLRWGGAGDVDEERRLMFVGMTRARSHLWLSCARTRRQHGQVKEVLPSPFLADIRDLVEDAGPLRSAPARRTVSTTGSASQLQLL